MFINNLLHSNKARRKCQLADALLELRCTIDCGTVFQWSTTE